MWFEWSNLNFNDRAYIASDYNNYKNWEKLKLPSTLDDVFKTEDFNGAILFRKSFTLHEIEGDNSKLQNVVSTFEKNRKLSAVYESEIKDDINYSLNSLDKDDNIWI